MSSAFAGLDGASFSNAPNAGTMFVRLDDYPSAQAKGPERRRYRSMACGSAWARIESANIFVMPPPPVRGIGTGGGFKMMVQDRSGKGYKALEEATVRHDDGAPTRRRA